MFRRFIFIIRTSVQPILALKTSREGAMMSSVGNLADTSRRMQHYAGQVKKRNSPGTGTGVVLIVITLKTHQLSPFHHTFIFTQDFMMASAPIERSGVVVDELSGEFG